MGWWVNFQIIYRKDIKESLIHVQHTKGISTLDVEEVDDRGPMGHLSCPYNDEDRRHMEGRNISRLIIFHYHFHDQTLRMQYLC